MELLRTPDECFDSLADYPFQPRYTDIDTDDDAVLRIHHVDEGQEDGPPVLCLHGQPVWSYVYRKMIPLLTGAGMRVIAPDLPGYGRSDKPAAREDYSYQRQVDWMGAWLVANDLSGITLFAQDWGGLIGLRLVADHPERFDRVVISNTGLPCPADVPLAVVEQVKAFREEARTPTLIEMTRALREVPESGALAFAHWQKFCWETEDVPVGLIMSTQVERASSGMRTLRFLTHRLEVGHLLDSDLARAYEAPFPDPAYKMAVRAMPSHVPTLPDDPSLGAQQRAWDFFSRFDKPFLCAFSDNDPITRGGDRPFLERVPGARGQPHQTVHAGGHFVQETCSQQVSEIIVDFIRGGTPGATPAAS
jgi:haloalkane dehalogenase